MDADTVPLPESKQGRANIWYFLAGGVAGVVSRSVTAPLDRFKVLLQTQTFQTRIPVKEVYIKAFAKIYADGGVKSFFRGNMLNCFKIFPESALKFFFFEYFKTAAVQIQKKDISLLTMTDRFLAGAGAGFLSQLAIYPIETVKTRIMSQIMTTSKSNMNAERHLIATVRNLWKENGVAAFYRGVSPALIGIIPYAGIDLAVFETLKARYLKNNNRKRVPMGWVLAFGITSGTCGAVLMYPLALIRTRLSLY